MRKNYGCLKPGEGERAEFQFFSSHFSKITSSLKFVANVPSLVTVFTFLFSITIVAFLNFFQSKYKLKFQRNFSDNQNKS